MSETAIKNTASGPLASETPRDVALFVTCLVDFFRPNVGFAAIKLLERAGCRVSVPAAQTCCGQPGYNSGDAASAAAIARRVIEVFEKYDYVVVPSGSCAGMISHHYPKLLGEDKRYAERARKLAAKTFELTQFLVDICGLTTLDVSLDRKVTFHDSCSSLREMRVKAQPRTLLGQVADLNFRELPDGESCCGFGGTFCVKYPEISDRMVTEKLANIEKSGADLLLAGDLGCLLNMAGKLKREGSKVESRHIAEVLAGLLEEPAIGEAASREER
ncbi:(Fe-S)-binding protein [Dongia soli]|uniref:(Fe-S)-binding protein n=1 Tax=Dongia soli TaxID=600628 RepID=A0ABU5E8C7_9PROT|nr:(Fe-S)-binding protein [Dongia soli]MDY0881994.1 (Fe-S)-binding protein [Dongia soli]